MNRTTTIILAAAAVILIAAGIAVKMIFFPSVGDEFFQLNQAKLRQAPAGVVILRPTHFAKGRNSGVINTYIQATGKRRLLGHNVTFKQLMAAAYGKEPALVALPADAPKGNYDFLVTTSDNVEGRLQAAIKKKLGYTAQMEMHDADVLALKVLDPSSSGLKASGPDEKAGQNMKDGRIYLTHQTMANIVNPVKMFLKTPVVDKTGLTGFYNFSVAMTGKLQSGNLNQDDIEKILNEWGLGLVADTASMEMLVVKKAL